MKSHERIYLQYKPDTIALDTLVRWQEKIADHDPNARLVNADRIHLTLIHFGIISEMYEQIKNASADLQWTQYENGLKSFINASQAKMPEETVIIATQLQKYGNGTVLAVKVEPSAILQAAHETALSYLKEFLRVCGVEHPVAFIQGNRNLRFGLKLNAHITLARASRRLPALDLNNTKLKLMKLPIHYQ